MQDINEKSHYASVISSLNKEYKGSKVGKNIYPNNIYLLDIVYNLLEGYQILLTDDERKQLLILYKTLLYKSDNICNLNIENIYQLSQKHITIQAEKTDCNNLPVIDQVFYWQESSPALTQSQILQAIINFDYLLTKKISSLKALSQGVTFSYTNVGRISFFIPNTTDINYEIRDIDNVVITDAFNIIQSITVPGVLITSKNFYSFSNIYLKINKL